MQNKPNLLKARINVTSFTTKDYENARPPGREKNKPNQTQSCRGVAFLPPRSLGEGGGEAGSNLFPSTVFGQLIGSNLITDNSITSQITKSELNPCQIMLKYQRIAISIGVMPHRGIENPSFSIAFHLFLSACRTVSCEISGTISSSTNLSASSRKFHLFLPSGGFEQRKAIKCASTSPSTIRLREGRSCFLRSRAACNPCSTNLSRIPWIVLVWMPKVSEIRLSVQAEPFLDSSA